MIPKPFRAPAMLLGLVACATTKPVADSGSTAASPAASVSSGSQVIRWSGSLQPTQQVTAGVGPTGQNKAFGTVVLTSKGPERMTAVISISTPLQGSTSLRWAILPGRCGTGSLPIVAVERFPMIEVASNGRAQLNNEMSLALPESGSYHVNVYWAGGSQLSDVMTCANLRRD